MCMCAVCARVFVYIGIDVRAPLCTHICVHTYIQGYCFFFLSLFISLYWNKIF